MIVEERIYDIAVGLVPDCVRFCAEAGLPVSCRHGLELAAYFAVEGGHLHPVVHYWLHESLAARQRRRLPRDADPDWRHDQQGARDRVTWQEALARSATDWAAFWRGVAPHVVNVERQFLRPIEPSPLR